MDPIAVQLNDPATSSDPAPSDDAAPRGPRLGVVVPTDAVDRARLPEDLALLADIGVDWVRIGVDWSWVQPRAGAVDGDAVEHYLGAARLALSIGLDLQLTLLDRDVPRWFDNDGGFTDPRHALHWWPRWVELCAEAFGDDVAGWAPVEHPLAIANRTVPDDPRRHGEVLDTLVTAWRDAWRILRGGPPVSTSFGVEVVRAADQTIPAAEAARRQDQLRWGLWLEGLRDGIVRIPGRADRELADLAGACDVVGVVVRHERDALGLIHRTAEMAPDRPLSVSFVCPAGSDADRENAIERYLQQTDEAASGTPLVAVGVTPVFDRLDDPPGEGRGIISRDRELKDSARRFLGLAG